MGDMTTQQKALAMLGLVGWTGFDLKLREDGTWYVSINADIRDGGCLVGVNTAKPTPEAAIEDTWKQLTDIEPDQYIVAKPGGKRRAVRWNGFMWSDVQEPAAD
jgi:hypothetical protein